MENTPRGFVAVLLLILAAILVGGGVYFFYTQQHTPASKPAVAPSVTKDVASTEPGITCRENDQYFVVQKDNAPDVGSDLLVKYKTSPDQQIPCTYSVGTGDYEIQNGNGAQYFSALAGNFLITDNGTAPDPRGLTVFDLTKRAQVFADIYSKPLSMDGMAVTYWVASGETPTADNCPGLSEYQSNGLGAALETRVTLDLSALTKSISSEQRCAARQ